MYIYNDICVYIYIYISGSVHDLSSLDERVADASQIRRTDSFYSCALTLRKFFFFILDSNINLYSVRYNMYNVLYIIYNIIVCII